MIEVSAKVKMVNPLPFHIGNYALTEAINTKKVSSIYLLLLRNRMRRNTVGFTFVSLSSVPLIMGQGKSWMQHIKKSMFKPLFWDADAFRHPESRKSTAD